MNVVRERIYRDHHPYSSEDAAELTGAGLPVVVTEKDAVKLGPLWPDSPPLHVVQVRFEPRDAGQEIDAVFDRIAALVAAR